MIPTTNTATSLSPPLSSSSPLQSSQNHIVAHHRQSPTTAVSVGANSFVVFEAIYYDNANGGTPIPTNQLVLAKVSRQTPIGAIAKEKNEAQTRPMLAAVQNNDMTTNGLNRVPVNNNGPAATSILLTTTPSNPPNHSNSSTNGATFVKKPPGIIVLSQASLSKLLTASDLNVINNNHNSRNRNSESTDADEQIVKMDTSHAPKPSSHHILLQTNKLHTTAATTHLAALKTKSIIADAPTVPNKVIIASTNANIAATTTITATNPSANKLHSDLISTSNNNTVMNNNPSTNTTINHAHAHHNNNCFNIQCHNVNSATNTNQSHLITNHNQLKTVLMLNSTSTLATTAGIVTVTSSAAAVPTIGPNQSAVKEELSTDEYAVTKDTNQQVYLHLFFFS